MKKTKFYIGSKEWYKDDYKIERNLSIALANIIFCVCLYLVHFLFDITFGFFNYPLSYMIIGWIVCGFLIYGYLIKKISELKKEYLKESKNVQPEKKKT